MGDNTSTHRENRAINVMRSVSALLVVLGHVRILFFEDYADAAHGPTSALMYSFTSLGSEAVMVFFVLSGYWVGGGVISKLRREAFTWSEYASSRMIRLWIVLLPALALTFVVDQVGRAVFPDAGIYANTSAYSGVPDTPSYSVITLLGNVFFTQSIHVSEFGLNKPLWSLAYEFWYYAMFPALLTVFWRGGRTSLRIAGGLVFVLSALIAGPAVLLLFPAWLAGAAVAANKAQISRVLSSISGRLLGALRAASIVVTLGAMILSHQVAMPSRIGAWIIAIAAAVLVSLFVVDVDWAGKRGKALDYLSRTAHFSYSLYAIHMPMVAFLAALMVPSINQRWPMDATHSAIGLTIVAGLLVAAYYFAAVTEQRTELVRGLLRGRASDRDIEKVPTRR